MSSEQHRVLHSQRIHDDETHIKKRQKLLKAKAAYVREHSVQKQPHRLHKHSGMNCGNANCVMCGNPRKFFNLPTIQEQRMYQNIDDLVVKEDYDDSSS